MTTESSRPIPRTNAYWRDRKQAFALIRTLEAAIRRRNAAPLYLPGRNYDPDGEFDDVIENTGPWERVDALRKQAAVNPTAVEILTANGRLALLNE
jgi:hypothetical protein